MLGSLLGYNLDSVCASCVPRWRLLLHTPYFRLSLNLGIRTNPLPDKNPLAVFTTRDKNPLAVLQPRTKTRSLCYHHGQKPARR